MAPYEKPPSRRRRPRLGLHRRLTPESDNRLVPSVAPIRTQNRARDASGCSLYRFVPPMAPIGCQILEAGGDKGAGGARAMSHSGRRVGRPSEVTMPWTVTAVEATASPTVIR